MPISERARYLGVGDVEAGLRNLSQRELLGVLTSIGDQFEELGVQTRITQLISEAIRDGVARSRKAERHMGLVEVLPVNFLSPLLRREPDLRSRLNDDNFEKLLDVTSTLAMTCHILFEKTDGIDYQEAGFFPDFE